MKKNLSSQDGFSLVELAIVLTIIGLIAGFSVPMLSESLHHKKWQKGERHLEEVTTALAAHVARYRRLPCAADPSAQGAERGLALEKCETSPFSIGLVPYLTLGLPESVAGDGYKRPFTYCVDSQLTRKNLSFENLCEMRGKRLSILGRDHQQMNQDPENPVAFVLIGYGEKGEGAYTKESGRAPLTSLSLPERTNAEDSMTFYDLPYSRKEDALFRQQVKWMTRDQLLLYYVKHPCVKSENLPSASAPSKSSSKSLSKLLPEPLLDSLENSFFNNN